MQFLYGFNFNDLTELLICYTGCITIYRNGMGSFLPLSAYGAMVNKHACEKPTELCCLTEGELNNALIHTIHA